MQFYKPFRLRGPLVALRRMHCSPFALRPLKPLPCSRDLSTSPLPLSFSLSLSLSLSLRLPLARALTQFCNFNLIFAHRYRPVQTAIMRADLIRHRCLSASAYFFRPLWHFRKNPRVAPHLCKITRVKKKKEEESNSLSQRAPRFVVIS